MADPMTFWITTSAVVRSVAGSAKALRLSVPPTLVVSADDVTE
jgi:hypothetical protein